MVFGLQVTPYLVCAAIWLPLRSDGAARAAYWLSLALFVVACLLYLPSWVRPRSGGDMVGLGYILVCLVTTGVIVVASVIILVASWLSRRSAPPNA